MLKLQDIEIISRKIDRSEILIAKFINGYASGWEFAVRKEFKSSLDIKKTKKVINKKTFEVETQGNVFSFEEGDTFHNSILAYEDWKTFIKGKNPITLQVQFCNSSGYVNKNIKKTLTTPLKIQDNSKEKNISSLKLIEQTLNKGYIKVLVYKPDNNKNKMIEDKYLEMNIFDFISLLQNGIFYDDNKEKYISYKYEG